MAATFFAFELFIFLIISSSISLSLFTRVFPLWFFFPENERNAPNDDDAATSIHQVTSPRAVRAAPAIDFESADDCRPPITQLLSYSYCSFDNSELKKNNNNNKRFFLIFFLSRSTLFSANQTPSCTSISPFCGDCFFPSDAPETHTQQFSDIVRKKPAYFISFFLSFKGFLVWLVCNRPLSAREQAQHLRLQEIKTTLSGAPPLMRCLVAFIRGRSKNGRLALEFGQRNR